MTDLVLMKCGIKTDQQDANFYFKKIYIREIFKILKMDKSKHLSAQPPMRKNAGNCVQYVFDNK